MTQVKDLIARVARLERELRERRQVSTTTRLGTRERPYTAFYARDPKTGTVARVEYDSDSNTLIPVKE
jgi:hypothetical protein